MSTLAPPSTDGLPPYLSVEQAAELLHQTPRSIHERTRLRQIPMRKMRGSRRILVPRDELLRFMNGSELEVLEKPDGTVVVRPVTEASS